MDDSGHGKGEGARRPSRRRGSALEQAILLAAADELMASGYAGLTTERVAKRARTNKNAIYRRWPNRVSLAVSAYRQIARSKMQPPDTGHLREDVLTMLRRINDSLSTPHGDLLRSMLAAASVEPELLAEWLEHAAQGGGDVWRTMVGRAVARGEARPEALRPRVATVALVLLRNEYVTGGLRPVPDAVIVDIVDQVYMPLVTLHGGHGD